MGKPQLIIYLYKYYFGCFFGPQLAYLILKILNFLSEKKQIFLHY